MNDNELSSKMAFRELRRGSYVSFFVLVGKIAQENPAIFATRTIVYCH
jgi:hypothetical protein